MPSPIKDNLRAGSADEAARQASIGAVKGAIKWGAVSALGGIAAYFVSPVFRGLTVQFRVYLWMCPTTIGSMMEADNRLRRYEQLVRLQKRAQIEDAREAALAAEIRELEDWEKLLEQQDTKL